VIQTSRSSHAVAMGASVCCKEKWQSLDTDDMCDGSSRPRIGLELRVRCSDGQHIKIEANPGWTVHDVMIAVMQRTGIHRVCQRLTFAGRRLEDFPARKLNSIKELTGGSTVFCTVLRDRFPEQLGPFDIASVPIKGQEFTLAADISAEVLAKQGAAWSLKREALKAAGVLVRRADPALCGHLAPVHAVTLTDEERQESQVPPTAQEFSWSYPVPGWEVLEAGSERSSAGEAFFQAGGFMYLDKKRRVLRATALMPSKTDMGGLQFCRPRRWEPQWTAALMKQGRFHEAASKVPTETGARLFCWLKPGEVLLGPDGQPLQAQPDIPHGGFAFLFQGVDSRSSSPGRAQRSNARARAGRSPAMALLRRDVDVKMDRYFAVAAGGGYRRRPSLKPEACRITFLPWRRGREVTPQPAPIPMNASNQFRAPTEDESKAPERQPHRNSVVRRVLSDPAITPEVTPEHWASSASGLVEVADTELKAKFQLLLAHAHKTSDNWTRDRGCKLHGVNGCDLGCSYEHRVQVPAGYTIVRVQRNQNLELWTKYCAMRAAISEECSNDSIPLERVSVKSSAAPFDVFEGDELQARHNEWRLFHGASKEACHRICSGNFDPSLAGMGATWKEKGDTWGLPLYGFGFYFAEQVTKADEYAEEDPDDPGAFTVLLCRVVGGRTNVVTEPSIDTNTLESQVLDGPYHSVFGDRVSVQKKPFREVMVYDKSQVYPEFMLTYRRRYTKGG